MSVNIDRLLRNAKTEIKAGRAAAVRGELLLALETFPANARLLAALAEVQQATTGMPPRPFGPPQLQHFLAVRNGLGLNVAIEEIAAAVRLNPSHPWPHSILGGALMEAGLLPAAIKYLALAVKLDPKFSEAGVNLAQAQQKADQLPQALGSLDQVLKHNSKFARAHLLRGRILTQLQAQRDEEAVLAFRSYLDVHPEDLEARVALASCLATCGKLLEARRELEEVLRLEPDHAAAFGNLGNVLLSEGDLEGASRLFERGLELNSRSVISFFNLGRARDFRVGEPLVAQMQSLCDDVGLTIEEQVALHFGLAKAFEDMGDAVKSFEYLKKANQLRASQARYSLSADQALLNDYLHRFSAKSPALAVEPSKITPIFVVGMMRSGTTLTEQILSSHPRVYGAGELDTLSRLLLQETALREGPLDSAGLLRIREGYLSKIGTFCGDASFVVDKLPANFRLVGLIRKAIPEARILHMNRNPVAVCWSIYKTFFTNLGIGYDTSITDTIGYYDLYADMMRRWRIEYPDGFMDVDYEALTRTPETVIRDMLDYCGLPFDAACLAPQDNKRAVRTASVRQVRNGIYQGSSGKWRMFEPLLGELTAHFNKT